ncbi:hypothetical protein ABCR94_38925 [Streptomyces sp. 21So2-11]|uniref:hypothetical protein n=1 Tax=Streptomyces sp. 21So2-11 TaxID=3144408 RepID=UPI00321BDAF4
MKYRTIEQLIGLVSRRTLFQVEYAEDDASTWIWLPHSQHEPKFEDPVRIGTNRLIYENMRREAIDEAAALANRYEQVRVVKLSVEPVWSSNEDDQD